jgi:hypothetical protein
MFLTISDTTLLFEEPKSVGIRSRIFYKTGVPSNHPLMKTFATSLATLLSAATVAFGGQAPTGFLEASSLMVRESGSVDLDWKVEFPPAEIIDDLVEIDDVNDRVTLKKEAKVDVRLLGSGYGNRYGHCYVESFAKFSDESSYSTFFKGFGFEVQPNKKLKHRNKVDEGTSLDFAFRGSYGSNSWDNYLNNSFNGWRVMGEGHGGILILKNGDAAPSFSPERSNQTAAKTFLSPFLSSDGSKIKIGQRDLIVLVDLNKSSAEQGADYQDFVILITVKEKKSKH